jgi:hypothetical protein
MSHLRQVPVVCADWLSLLQYISQFTTTIESHLRQVPVEDGCVGPDVIGDHFVDEAVVEGNAFGVDWGALAALGQDAVPGERKPARRLAKSNTWICQLLGL